MKTCKQVFLNQTKLSISSRNGKNTMQAAIKNFKTAVQAMTTATETEAGVRLRSLCVTWGPS